MIYIACLSLAMLTIFSCKKKEEPVDPCTNGFLDPGEQGVDCGGSCAPCNSIPPSFLDFTLNGSDVLVTDKSLQFNGTDYILSMSNDSIFITLNLGSNPSPGAYTPTLSGTSCTYNGIPYPNISNASHVISHHDSINQLLSGYFDIDFSRTGFTDTLHITNGVFEYMPY